VKSSFHGNSDVDENGEIGEVIWVSRCVDLKSGAWLRSTYRPESVRNLKA